MDLVIKYHYDYDTVYTVYREWNKSLKATESTLISAWYMGIDPLDITQESMARFGEVIKQYMISMEDLK